MAKRYEQHTAQNQLSNQDSAQDGSISISGEGKEVHFTPGSSKLRENIYQ